MDEFEADTGETVLTPGYNLYTSTEELKGFIKQDIFKQISWHENDSVYLQAVRMLEKAFNPLRMMSTELYLYKHTVRMFKDGNLIEKTHTIEGPLLEMELWLKPDLLLAGLKMIKVPSESDYPSVQNYKEASLKTRREIDRLLGLRPVVDEKTIETVKSLSVVPESFIKKPKVVNIAVAPVTKTTTVVETSDAPATKKARIYRQGVKLNKNEKVVIVREKILKFQGYALAYSTIKVYLRNMYLMYINNELQRYLTQQQTFDLQKLLDSLVEKLLFFKLKYHRYMFGVRHEPNEKQPEVTYSGGFFRKGNPSKNTSIGPQMLQPHDLEVYVLLEGKWKILYIGDDEGAPNNNTGELIQDQEDVQTLDISATIKDLDKGYAMADKEDEALFADKFDVLGEFDDVLGEFGQLCMKCLKSCE